MNDIPKFKTLKDQLAAEIADAEALDPARYRGGDWYHLTDEEEFVFDIDRDRFPRMVTTWSCYEAFKLIADHETWSEDLITEARAQHPEWCEPGISTGEFQAFAKEFAGLTFRESDAFYSKNKYWCVRVGIMQFSDDPQHDDEP
jgi:hypothetical protein